ncbi:MAG: hypothetical protein H0T59_05035 [Chloroflexi bacterium]|nr:hypothetical protein [Chloroflexota bacterium]
MLRRIRGPRAFRIGLALATATAQSLVLAVVVLGASPSPNAGGGDPRSSGQGPGLVGDPLFAVVGVIVVGLAALLLTLAYVRITGRRGT